MTQPASRRVVTEARGAPLAQAGQAPAQEPVAPGVASVGSLANGARADHAHPLGHLGRSLSLGTLPPSYAYDMHLDGTQTVHSEPDWWGSLVNAPVGNVYSITYAGNGSGYGGAAAANSIATLMARAFVLDAGVTLKSNPGCTLLIACSESITIDGTLDTSGASASGATAPANGGGGSGTGGSGTSGTTGAGGGGLNAFGGSNGQKCVGGGSGAGGASGATAGGAAIAQEYYQGWGFDLNAASLLYLTIGGAMAGAGAGGGAGAGDGTNAGGASGGGAGHIILIAPKITIGAAAHLIAKGGAGAAGTGGNAGGGGGGGGGMIATHAFELSVDPAATLDNTGGAGGAGSGSGSAGGSGTLPHWFGDPPIDHGGLGRGQGFLLCQWQ